MASKRKRNTHSLEFKSSILRRHLYKKEKINDLAKEFDIPQNTISTWKKQADKIFKDAADSTPNRKRMRVSPYRDIELGLLYWLKDMRSKEVPPPLDGQTLMTKAEKYVNLSKYSQIY